SVEDGPETLAPVRSLGGSCRFPLRLVERLQRCGERATARAVGRRGRLDAPQRLQLVVVHLAAHKSPLRVFFASWMCQETVASLHPRISPTSAWLFSSA